MGVLIGVYSEGCTQGDILRGEDGCTQRGEGVYSEGRRGVLRGEKGCTQLDVLRRDEGRTQKGEFNNYFHFFLLLLTILKLWIGCMPYLTKKCKHKI